MNENEACRQLLSNSEHIFNETKRILLKIADNILNNPTNEKVRTLQKCNVTVSNKILAVKGGVECLKLLGFRESESAFIFPKSQPVAYLEGIKQQISQLKWVKSIQQNIAGPSNPEKIERIILPPLNFIYSNPFLRRIEQYFHNAQYFDNPKLQNRANILIPISELGIGAQQGLRLIQQQVKQKRALDPNLTIQDFMVMELLYWFKNEFFTWIDTPQCADCGDATKMSHMSTDPADLIYTERVEVYKCTKCPALTKFPRYNDLNILLETRRGRCGEWAQVFTLMCRSMGWDARFVVDELDHVWTEVYSIGMNRWVHCDSCENTFDLPLMYESGWGKKLSYVLAYSGDEVQDVTWRYTSDHKEVLKRRSNCSEQELIDCLMNLREKRQKNYSQARKDYLTKRLVMELFEFFYEKKPGEGEFQGRLSGSRAWRVERGEINESCLFVWQILDKHLINNKITIQYSTALDRYEFITDTIKMMAKEWYSGIFSCTNVFRKEEKDWKTVYLARTEGSNFGKVSWRIEVKSDKVIDTVYLKFIHKTYENGQVVVRIGSDGTCLDFPQSSTFLESAKFSGSKMLEICVELKGGKGNVAWQHAQLFRQSTNSEDYPFVLSLTFKDNK